MKAKLTQEEMDKNVMDHMILNGYHNTNVREVMTSVGLNKGSFLNYYANKEEMGQSALSCFTKMLLGWQAQVMAREDLTPFGQIELFYSALINHYKTETGFTRGCLVGNFSTELADVNETFRLQLDEFFKTFNGNFARNIRKSQELGEINHQGDPEALAELLMMMWEGAVLRMKTTADSRPLDLFFHDFLKLLQ